MRGSAPRRAKTMHKQLHSPQPITHSTPQPAAQTPQANPRRLSWSPRRRSLSAAHTPSQPSHRAVGPKDPTNVTAAPRLFNFRQESVVGIKRIQQYLSHLPLFSWPFPPFSPLFLLGPFGGGAAGLVVAKNFLRTPKIDTCQTCPTQVCRHSRFTRGSTC